MILMLLMASPALAAWPWQKKKEKVCHYSFRVRSDLSYIFAGPCGKFLNVGILKERRAIVLNKHMVPVLDAKIPGDNSRRIFFEKYWPNLTEVEYFKESIQ